MKIQFLLIIPFYICYSCSHKSMHDRQIVEFESNLTDTIGARMICPLKENIGLIGDITDFTIINDTLFVVLTNKNSFLYYIDGTQLKQLGYAGRAKGEMISPSSVFVTKKHIYIWCRSLLKFTVFDFSGNLIDELTGFTRALKKFTVNDDETYIYMYTTGERNDNQTKFSNIIQIFDTDKRIVTEKFGNRSVEDEVMSLYGNSGGISVDIDKLLYLNPAYLDIYLKKLSDNSEIVYSIRDSDFKTEKMNDPQMLTSIGANTLQYISQNSVAVGIHCSGNKVYVIAEVGQLDFDNERFTTDAGNRKQKIYIFDNQMKPVESRTFSTYYYSPMKMYNRSIYLIEPKYSELSDNNIANENIYYLKYINL